MKNKEPVKPIKIKFSTAVTIIIILAILFVVWLVMYVNKSQGGKSTSREKGEELSISSELVSNLRSKLTLNNEVLGHIYNVGDIDTTTISNQMILILGWNNLDLKSTMDKLGNEDYVSDEITFDAETGEGKVTITKEKMKESIESIFGNNITYTDATFFNICLEPYFYSDNTQDEIIYEDGKYTVDFTKGIDETEQATINEVVESATKYSDRIEICVYTIFENKDDNENTVYYKDYYMENEVADSNNSENFHKYVYTYKLDNETNEYYFSGFEQKDDLSTSELMRRKYEQAEDLFELSRDYFNISEEPMTQTEDGIEYYYYEITNYEEVCNRYLTSEAKEYFDSNIITLAWIDGVAYEAEGGGDARSYSAPEISDISEQDNSITSTANVDILDNDGETEKGYAKTEFKIELVDNAYKISIYQDGYYYEEWDELQYYET